MPFQTKEGKSIQSFFSSALSIVFLPLIRQVSPLEYFQVYALFDFLRVFFSFLSSNFSLARRYFFKRFHRPFGFGFQPVFAKLI